MKKIIIAILVAALVLFGASYALNGIEHEHTRIVSYYEVSLTFDYARTAAELDSIVPISSVRSLSGVLSSATSQ